MNIKWEEWTIGEDGCPCGEARWKGFEFHTHCWRTGMCCAYSGVHIQKYPKGQFKKAKKLAKMIARGISRGWQTHVEVNLKPYP